MRITSVRGAALIACGLILLGAGAVAAVPGLRWRASVIALEAGGRLADIGWRELLPMIAPGSSQSLAPLVESRNPYAVIHNVHQSKADIESGRKLFRDRCAVCHAPDASGGPSAPSLIGRALTHGASDWALFRTIRYGIPGSAMPAHPEIPPVQVWRLAAFIRALQSAHGPASGGGAEAPRTVAIDVPYEELENTRRPGRDWLTYSGSYSGVRNSVLRSIDTGNVGALALRWLFQFSGNLDMVQCSPLVRNGVMFATLPPGRVLALDASSGRLIWSFEASPAPPQSEPVSESVNRGVALLDDRVFVGTWDARLIALSASDGRKLWETRVEDSAHHWISAAPLAYRDLVVIGTGFKEGRGVLRAYDAATGKERWHFDSIPPPGAPHHDSWGGDSWRGGGAPTWLTGTYDPESNLLYWGIGNPKPDYDASGRRGDNLYSNSVVALDASTGRLVWYFQFTPHDDHDWDSNQIPMLADIATPSGVRKLLLLANRNGFFYELDRLTGRFIRATAYARQTWTAGIDANGRPIPLPASSLDARGRLTYPSNLGATNWWPPSFDPQLGLVFVPMVEHGMVFFPETSGFPEESNQALVTGVRALDAESGRLVWERTHEPRGGIRVVGGLLSTAGGLVFGGDADQFFSLEARTGRVLWSVRTGGNVVAAPVTYEAGGEQFVAVAAGRDLLAFALPARTESKAAAAQEHTH